MPIIMSPEMSQVKPPMWAIDPGIVFENASRMGLPMPVAGYIWGGGDRFYDIGGSLWHGALTGDAVWIVDKYGPAIKFDGDLDYVALGGAINTKLINPLTIFARFKPEVDNDVLLMNRSFYNGAEGIEIATNASQIIMRGSSADFVLSTQLIYNQWNTCVFIFDSTLGTIYTKGVYDNSGAIASIIASTAGYCSIGRYGDHSDYGWQGLIDTVQIFPTAFTASQAATISANPYGLVQQPRRIWAVAAAGVAPTGNLYGPLWGPLAGVM